MRIELEFFGEIPNVKDSYRAILRKRKKPIPGKPDTVAGLVKDRKLNEKLNYLIRQIPTEHFDAKLLHPTVTFQRWCPLEYLGACTGKNLSDRSGAWVTLEDLLVRTGILVDDSDLFNNGNWVIHSTLVGDCHKTIVTLEGEPQVA